MSTAELTSVSLPAQIKENRTRITDLYAGVNRYEETLRLMGLVIATILVTVLMHVFYRLGLPLWTLILALLPLYVFPSGMFDRFLHSQRSEKLNRWGAASLLATREELYEQMCACLTDVYGLSIPQQSKELLVKNGCIRTSFTAKVNGHAMSDLELVEYDNTLVLMHKGRELPQNNGG